MSISRLFVLLSSLPVAVAHAAPDRFDLRRDGSVAVGGEHFPSLTAFYQSDAFQRQNLRCGSAHAAPRVDPTAFTIGDCSMTRTRINTEYDDGTTLVIQVVFHVITKSDGTGALSKAAIDSQLAVLNEDFGALPASLGASGHNTRVKFVLARFDPDGNPTSGVETIVNDTYFADPGSGAPNPMKVALHWDPERYLNVYTNDAGGNGLLGYATFPAEDAGSAVDGVVMNHVNVGRNVPGAAPYDLGRTLTHEVGHYFGLYHTFQDGCGTTTAPYTTGDLIADTARELEASYGCTPAPSACGGGSNPITNYMDYTDDRCMTGFSREQGNRLRCGIINYRNVNTEPEADFTFTAAKTAVTVSALAYDNESENEELAVVWDFGDGATSNDPQATHAYARAGSYTVTLEVIDPDSATAIVQKTVTVGSPAGGDDDPAADPATTGGCRASGGTGAGAALASVLAMLFGARRRRVRRQPA